MARQRWAGRLVRILVLLAPGAALMSTGTSCGDQIRQSMLDTGTNFFAQSVSLLIESAVTDLLTGQTADQAAAQN